MEWSYGVYKLRIFSQLGWGLYHTIVDNHVRLTGINKNKRQQKQWNTKRKRAYAQSGGQSCPSNRDRFDRTVCRL